MAPSLCSELSLGMYQVLHSYRRMKVGHHLVKIVAGLGDRDV
jgi:hypothetical protein